MLTIGDTVKFNPKLKKMILRSDKDISEDQRTCYIKGFIHKSQK